MGLHPALAEAVRRAAGLPWGQGAALITSCVLSPQALRTQAFDILLQPLACVLKAAAEAPGPPGMPLGRADWHRDVGLSGQSRLQVAGYSLPRLGEPLAVLPRPWPWQAVAREQKSHTGPDPPGFCDLLRQLQDRLRISRVARARHREGPPGQRERAVGQWGLG